MEHIIIYVTYIIIYVEYTCMRESIYEDMHVRKCICVWAYIYIYMSVCAERESMWVREREIFVKLNARGRVHSDIIIEIPSTTSAHDAWLPYLSTTNLYNAQFSSKNLSLGYFCPHLL